MKIHIINQRSLILNYFLSISIILLTLPNNGLASNEVDPQLQEIVDITKKSQRLPYQIDKHTVWKDVYPDGKSLHYLYMVSEESAQYVDLKESKNTVIPTFCSGVSLDLVNQGYFYQVTYEVENSSKKINFSITQSDCQDFTSKDPVSQRRDLIQSYVDLIKSKN
jgi:hypothetical protein